MNEDLLEISKLQPELIHVSDCPATWLGVMNLSNCKTKDEKVKLKVKLIFPCYPRLDYASVSFGNSLGFLCSKNLHNHITAIIKNCESVACFLQELHKLLESKINSSNIRFPFNEEAFNYNIGDNKAREKLLEELNKVLSEYSDIEFSSTQDLSEIKLTLLDASITVQPTVTTNGTNSWKIVSSDLPQISDIALSEKRSLTLKEIRNWFQKQVDLFQEFWNQMGKLDRYCWIIDPIHPKLYHVYRRIYLSPSLCIFVTLNPWEPTNIPNIKFKGTKAEEEQYSDILSNIILEWDPQNSVYENLLNLLNIDEFPKPTESNHSSAKGGIVGEDECCICFSLESDSGEIPAVTCANEKCQRNFHSSCLYQWLQESVINKVVFNEISGKCPNCNNEITCSILNTFSN